MMARRAQYSSTSENQDGAIHASRGRQSAFSSTLPPTEVPSSPDPARIPLPRPIRSLKRNRGTKEANGETLLEPMVTTTLLKSSQRKKPRTTKDCSSFHDPISVADAFNLKYRDFGSQFQLILGTPTTPVPETLPQFVRFIESYVDNFDRSSEAACRCPVDMLLNECLIILKRQHFCAKTGTLEEFNDFNKCQNNNNNALRFQSALIISAEVHADWVDPSSGITYSGRMDYSIGIALRSIPIELYNITYPFASTQPRCPYNAHLLVVEAKRTQTVGVASAQLFAYMAILYKHRMQATPIVSRPIYGIATDGIKYEFLAINSSGVMQRSQTLSIGHPAGAREVVAAVVWILESTLGEMEVVVNQVKNSVESRRESQGHGEDDAVEVNANISGITPTAIEQLKQLAGTVVFPDSGVINITTRDSNREEKSTASVDMEDTDIRGRKCDFMDENAVELDSGMEEGSIVGEEELETEED